MQRSSPTIKEKLQEKPMPVSPSPHPAIFSGPKTVPSSSQTSSSTAPGLDKSSLEAKTPFQPKNSHARTPYNSQLVSTLAPSQPVSVAAVSVPTLASIQSAPALKPSQPSLQSAPVLPTSEHISHPSQAPSQINLVASPMITPVQVPAAIPTQTTLASCGSIPDAPVESTPSIQPTFISNPPLLPASAIPVSGQAPAAARILDAPESPSTTLPIDGRSVPPIAQKTVDPHTTMTPIPLSQASLPSISPPSGPAHAPLPDLPQSSDPQPCETSAIPSSGKFCLI